MVQGNDHVKAMQGMREKEREGLKMRMEERIEDVQLCECDEETKIVLAPVFSLSVNISLVKKLGENMRREAGFCILMSETLFFPLSSYPKQQQFRIKRRNMIIIMSCIYLMKESRERWMKEMESNRL